MEEETSTKNGSRLADLCHEIRYLVSMCHCKMQGTGSGMILRKGSFGTCIC